MKNKEKTKPRRWTEEETNQLRAEALKGSSVRDLAAKFNCSWDMMDAKFRAMGIVRGSNGRPMSKHEEDYIRKHYNTKPQYKIAEHLNVSVNWVTSKAAALGLYEKITEYWTTEQDRYLKRYYRTKSDVELAERINALHPRKFKGPLNKKSIQKRRGYLALKRTIKESTIIKLGYFDEKSFEGYDRKKGGAKEGAKRIYFHYGKPYYAIKVNGRFVELHKHNWIKHRGPIPKGMILYFKNNNSLQWQLKNMGLLPKREFMKLMIQRRDEELSDHYIATILARKIGRRCKPGEQLDAKLISHYKQNPDLIEAKRQQIILSRTIKSQERHATRT